MIETTLDYDKHGHCVNCHKNMKFMQAIEGVLQERFTPDYQERTVFLTNGSKMRVAICKQCNKLELDMDKIMECVYKGWEKEVERMVKDETKPKWTKEFGEAHLKRQKPIKIIYNADGIKDDILLDRLKVYKEKEKIKELKEVK